SLRLCRRLARRCVSGGGCRGHRRQVTLDQRTHRIGRLRAFADPVVDALLLHVHEGRAGARVVMSEDFDERAVAGGPGIGDDDAEVRTLLGTGATQTNGDHLTLLLALEARSSRADYAAPVASSQPSVERPMTDDRRPFEPARLPAV